MPFVQLDTGIRMHYRDCGDGKPILFIPGLSATVETWNYQVLGLAEDFRCVCVDLRGHGDSDKPFSAYTYQEMCADLSSLIRLLDLKESPWWAGRWERELRCSTPSISTRSAACPSWCS